MKTALFAAASLVAAGLLAVTAYATSACADGGGPAAATAALN